MPNTKSDADLVTAAKRGNRPAFAALVDRYSKSVRAVAFHTMGDFHASEDVAQEAFVVAYQRLNNLREGSLFGRWLLKIARHQAMRARSGRRNDLPLNHADDVPSGGTIAFDTEHLMGEVMRLPERERRLLMLRYFNGHSIEEIAKITGRPVGTVTKQLSRGYARLRERLVEVVL